MSSSLAGGANDKRCKPVLAAFFAMCGAGKGGEEQGKWTTSHICNNNKHEFRSAFADGGGELSDS